MVFESRMQCLRVLRHFLHSEIPILEWDPQHLKALALDRRLLRHSDNQILELDRQYLKVLASDRFGRSNNGMGSASSIGSGVGSS